MSDVESAPAERWVGSNAMRRGEVRRNGMRGRGRSWLLFAAMPALSGVNALVGLVLPGLLGPAAFGEYALVTTLFQYGLIFDLGVSQVIDRKVPVLTGPELAGFAHVALWARVLIAAATAAAGTVLLAGLGMAKVLPFGEGAGVLSLLAGLAFMLALGPMAMDRAASQRRAFAVASAACGVVLATARPLGILVGGIAGSFAGLLAGYAIIAALVARRHPLQTPAPRLAEIARLIGQGIPLFATSFVWAFYMTANRWVVSFLAPPLELGHFAFGANIVALIVGTVGALSQFYYPSIVGRAAAGGHFSMSAVVSRDLSRIALLLAAGAAFGMLAGPRLIALAYPSFAGSQDSVQILLAAVPSLVVSSWLMPLSLSTAARPWIDGALCYPVALLMLGAGTAYGYHKGGITGAGWGMVVSAPALLTFQLAALRLARLLTARGAVRLLLVTLSLTVLLAGLAIRVTT